MTDILTALLIIRERVLKRLFFGADTRALEPPRSAQAHEA
jgi:hypothetical protein